MRLLRPNSGANFAFLVISKGDAEGGRGAAHSDPLQPVKQPIQGVHARYSQNENWP